MEAGEILPSVDLKVSISTESALLDLLPPGERDDPRVGVGVLFHSIPSRIRRLVSLEESGPLEWSGKLELDGDSLLNSATLEPVMYRLDESTETIVGKAAHKAARIGWGPAIRFLFDYFPEPGSHWLKMEWVDFESEPALKDLKDLLFVLDVDAPGQLPVLRLNESIDGLKTILMAPNKNSHLRRLRDSVGSAIALQAGTQMSLHVTSRIFAAAKTDPDASPEELIDELRGWEQEVVKYWSTKVFPETGASAITKFAEDASDSISLAGLNARLGIESQRLVDLRGSFGGLNLIKESLGA